MSQLLPVSACAVSVFAPLYILNGGSGSLNVCWGDECRLVMGRAFFEQLIAFL